MVDFFKKKGYKIGLVMLFDFLFSVIFLFLQQSFFCFLGLLFTKKTLGKQISNCLDTLLYTFPKAFFHFLGNLYFLNMSNNVARETIRHAKATYLERYPIG